MCALFSPNKFPCFLKKKTQFFKENMILVGSWKVELEFRVLAPTSMYALDTPEQECSICEILIRFNIDSISRVNID